MQFITALHNRDVAEAACKRLSESLRDFPRDENGLTPDHIKFSPEYDAVNMAYKRAFNELRAWNGLLTGKFKAQYKEHRANQLFKGV